MYKRAKKTNNELNHKQQKYERFVSVIISDINLSRSRLCLMADMYEKSIINKNRLKDSLIKQNLQYLPKRQDIISMVFTFILSPMEQSLL